MRTDFVWNNFDTFDLTLVLLDGGNTSQEDYFLTDGPSYGVAPLVPQESTPLVIESGIFNLGNIDSLGFETIATYTSEYFEVGDLASFNVGGAATQTAIVRVKGETFDFNFFKQAKMSKLVFSGENTPDNPKGEIVFLTMFLKHPVTFDGQYISLTLDSIPSNNFVGVTTEFGEALPYSFGTTFVSPVLISKKNLGASLETVDVLSIKEVNEILDAYSACLKPIFCSGKLLESADDISDLEAITNFRLTVLKAVEAHPKHKETLLRFLDLLQVKGITAFQQPDKDGKPVYISNIGYLCPVNLMSSIYSGCNSNFFGQLKIDYNLADKVEEKFLLYSSVGDLGETSDNINLKVLEWINTLTKLPEVIKADFGAYKGELKLNIDSKEVLCEANTSLLDGSAAGDSEIPNTLKIKSVRVDKKETLIFESYSSTAIKLVDSAINKDLRGKFLYIESYFKNGATATYISKVLDQIAGVVLMLDVVPYSSDEGLLLSGVITAISDSPIPELTEPVAIARTEIGVPDQFDGGVFKEGDTYFRVRSVPYLELSTDGSTWESQELAEKYAINASQLKNYRVRYLKSGVEVTSEILKYDADTGFYMKEEPDTLAVEEDCTSKETYGMTHVYRTDFSFSISAGQELELYDEFVSVYIIDVRENCPVLDVYSKIGKSLFKVPESWYRVDKTFKYAGANRTALIVSVPFSKMGLKDLSDEIVVKVDVAVHSEFSTNEPYSFVSYLIVLAAKFGYILRRDQSIGVYYPRFTVYGYTPILEVLTSLVEESNCGYFLDYPYLSVTALNVKKSPVFSFNETNVESFTLETSDSLTTYTNTLFTWDTFTPFTGKMHLSVPRYDDVTLGTSSKKITKYTSSAKILEFAKYYMHRNGRNWLKINLVGFLDSVHLQPLDCVSVSLGGLDILAEVQTFKYDHETGSPNFELLLDSPTYGYGHSLWTTSDDVGVRLIDGITGYIVENNKKFETYYNGHYHPPI